MGVSLGDNPSSSEVELIIGNSNSNFSGVTSTMLQVLSHQKSIINARVMGAHYLDDPSLYISFWKTIKLCRKPLTNGKYRIFHARRVDEMIQAVLLKYVFRAKINIVFSSAAQRHRSKLTCWLINQMDAVVAVSKGSAKYLPRRPDKIIYHGTNTELYAPALDRDKLWKSMGISGKYAIGILGRVRKQKGVHLFVNACIDVLKNQPDYTAIIVGPISSSHEGYVNELKRKIAAENMNDRIVFIGEQPYSEIPDIFRSLSLVTALSDNEGFGLTVLEAMSSGSAVLATDAGAWSEIINEGSDGFVVPVNDQLAITDKLADLLSDHERLIEMGQAGRRHVEEFYTIKREATELCEFFRTL